MATPDKLWCRRCRRKGSELPPSCRVEVAYDGNDPSPAGVVAHEWVEACARCGQFVHERGCAAASGAMVNPAAAMRSDLVEIDAVLSEAGVPQEFAGQPLTLPERVRWLVRAVETNREAFRRQVKGRAEERAIWAEKKLQYERQLAARGRKLIFLRRIPAAKGACVLFDREYRNAWTHEEFSAFLKRHASQPAGQALWAQNPVKGPVGRIEIGERAETRCPVRLSGHQCTRAIDHYPESHLMAGSKDES